MLAIREVLDGRADSAAIISLEPSAISKLYGSLNSQFLKCLQIFKMCHKVNTIAQTAKTIEEHHITIRGFSRTLMF